MTDDLYSDPRAVALLCRETVERARQDSNL